MKYLKGVIAGLILGLAAVTGMAFLVSPAHAQLDITDSGIWYEPDLPGHGLIITTWNETAELEAGANVAWFTQTPEGDGQAWLISDNLSEGERSVTAYIPMGAFPALGHVLGEPVAELSFRKQSTNVLRMDYSIFVWDRRCDGRPQAGPLPPFCAGTILFRRLTPIRS